MTLALDRRADLWGDRTAVIDHTDDHELSYAALDAAADRAAGRLAARGIGSGDAVAVLARNRPALLALAFGTRRLDATLAPVSYRLAGDPIAALGDRIDPALWLAEERFADLVPSGTDSATLDAFEGGDPAPTPGVAAPEHPRFYLHTGGTTGTPKVVVVSERQVEWNCVTETAAWGLGKATVAPVLLPMFHTGGWLLLTLPTLYVGGRVLLQRSFDPEGALAMIEAHDATQVFGVAAVFKAMADHDAFEDTDLSSVEWFMSGGGPTPEAVMAAYRDRGATFVQGYGLTEGGPNNLYVDPTRPDAHAKPDSVGRSFPDCSIRIVDEVGDPVDDGAIGELEVTGPVTADGYLDTEDGTFAGDWVSTGDLVERDADGDIAVVGRTDNMFVSGGENVHPEPIERTLEAHPAIEAVGVVGVPHDRWGRVPKAVVVGDLDEPTLERYARERLADHEVPKEVVFADELPMSGPGKLDRAGLKEAYGR